MCQICKSNMHWVKFQKYFFVFPNIDKNKLLIYNCLNLPHSFLISGTHQSFTKVFCFHFLPILNRKNHSGKKKSMIEIEGDLVVDLVCSNFQLFGFQLSILHRKISTSLFGIWNWLFIHFSLVNISNITIGGC